MSLARLKIHHRSTAQILVFLFLSLISFRMLYGVPPVAAEVKAAQPTTIQQTLNPDSAKTPKFHLSNALNNSKQSSESSNNKELPPYKTFKNKIIKEKSFNPTEILDFKTIKFSSETPQLFSPSLGKRYLSTHSNAPPVIK